MRNEIRNLSWRKIIIISVLLAGIFGMFDVYGIFSKKVYGNLPGPWKCPDGGTIECTAVGCVKSSSEPDSYWVCRYSGSNCPPLEACNP
jgi:hypothetical protein